MGKIGREKPIALVGFTWNRNSVLLPCSMNNFWVAVFAVPFPSAILLFHLVTKGKRTYSSPKTLRNQCGILSRGDDSGRQHWDSCVACGSVKRYLHCMQDNLRGHSTT